MTPKNKWLLDLDVGNTRTKWRLSLGGENIAEGFSAGGSESLEGELERHTRELHRCRLSNVAGPERASEIAAWLNLRWGIEVESAVVSAESCGVSNSYQQPQQLGVDRWLAAIAAYNTCRQACLVVDCGSAVTVELLSSEGCHIGGYIVPGLGLMRRSLFQDTDAVKVEAADIPEALKAGVCTKDAVNNGLLLMVIGLIEKAMEELQAIEPDVVPGLIITGGDGAAIIPFLPPGAVLNDGLVMDGLAVLMP